MRLVRDTGGGGGVRRGPGGIPGLAAAVPSEIAALWNSSILGRRSQAIQLFSHQQPAWVLLNVKWGARTCWLRCHSPQSLLDTRQARRSSLETFFFHEVLSLVYKKVGFASLSDPSLAMGSSSPREGTLGDMTTWCLALGGYSLASLFIVRRTVQMCDCPGTHVPKVRKAFTETRQRWPRAATRMPWIRLTCPIELLEPVFIRANSFSTVQALNLTSTNLKVLCVWRGSVCVFSGVRVFVHLCALACEGLTSASGVIPLGVSPWIWSTVFHQGWHFLLARLPGQQVPGICLSLPPMKGSENMSHRLWLCNMGAGDQT